MGEIGDFGIQFIGHIVLQRNLKKRKAMVNFINDCHCLTTKDWAIEIDDNKGKYRVERIVLLQQDTYDIKKVLYKNVDDDVAAYWGVVRVSYKI